MKVNLNKKVNLTKREGKHRRAGGTEAILNQIIVSQGKLWRWSEPWHGWLGAGINDDTRVARREQVHA